MDRPIRVLQVLGGTTLCGAESRIMDLYRNINRDEVQFDFVVHNQNEDYFNKEIRELGGNIYRIPRFRLFNIIAYCRAWRDFFREHNEFQAVHGHMTSTASLYLPIAKKSGVPITIAHARSAGTDPGIKGIITRMLRSSLVRKADYCFSCSMEASVAVFGKKAVNQGKVKIIPNAIEVDKYQYDTKTRQEMREKYQIEDQFVVGHVGRFHYAKNHEFLVDIFSEIIKREPNAILLLVGEGELMTPIKEKAMALGLEDKVIFAGSQPQIARFYQMMDYMVFPSHFEGLPGTVVEAQASGLRCLISDKITREVVITPLVNMKSISLSAGEWAEEVVKNKDYSRETDNTLLKEYGFDVRTQVERLTRFYRNGRFE